MRRSSSVLRRDRAALAQLKSEPISKGSLDAIRSEKTRQERSCQSPAYIFSRLPVAKRSSSGFNVRASNDAAAAGTSSTSGVLVIHWQCEVG